NPVLYSEGESVWMFFAVVPIGWSTGHIEMQHSTDGGSTWSHALGIAAPIGANVRCPPVRLKQGDLLLPAYEDLFYRSVFLVSKDTKKWDLLPIVSSPDDAERPIQPSVVQLDSGRLLAVMRNTGRNFLWVMASDDDGKTWSQPSDSGFPNPASSAALFKLANGHIILVFNDSPTDRRPLTVALSEDEGRTWPSRR